MPPASINWLYRPPILLRRTLCSRIPISSGRRGYAVQAPGAPRIQVFNEHTKWLHKENAALNVEASRTVDYLRDEVASRLCARLLDINRRFPKALDLGANACNIARTLAESAVEDDAPSPSPFPLPDRIDELTAADTSHALLHRDTDLPFNAATPMRITRDVLPSLEHLPYAPNTFDLVISSLSLHWINDLPSTLRSINSVLKPDAPFIAAMFGGDTLFELRTSLQLAEQDRRGGVAPHVSPLADVRDVGGLLQGAGFKLLTVDVDDIVVDFPDVFSLMKDLQAMGEQNAVHGREMGPLRRDVLVATDAIYRELHGNGDGSVPATFRLIYMIGWKAGPSQKGPLPRGSGMVSIKDTLEQKGGNVSGDENK